MKITANNVDILGQLVTEAESTVEAIDFSITDSIQAWQAFQEEPPTTADGREERRDARETMENEIIDLATTVADAIQALTDLQNHLQGKR